jgi:hypothetical protein
MNFAFYGQAIMTSRMAARPIRAQQLADATTRAAHHDGTIVANYFDVYPDRHRALWHRRQATQMLRAIEDPQRSFDAIIIGDTASTLTPAVYDSLLTLCSQHGVQLWLPEVDGPVDRHNEEHQEIILEVLWGGSPRFWNTIMQSSTEDPARPLIDSDHRVAPADAPPIPTPRTPPVSDVPHPSADAPATPVEDLP